jgi:hypothetical protein
MKYVKGFFEFWYDFIVGDSVLLAIGGIAILALGFGLVQAGVQGAAEVLMPAIAVGTIIVSVPVLKRR